MKFRVYYIVTAVVLTFALLSVIRHIPVHAKSDPPYGPSESPFTSRVAATGIVEARDEEVAVGSHLSGVVDKVAVSEDEKVRKGDLLFVLDTRSLRAQRNEAVERISQREAEHQVASMRLRDAKERLEFALQVKLKGAVSREELTGRTTAVEIAAAEVEAARAAVEVARRTVARIETDLELSRVTAPQDGTVLTVDIQAGEYVSAQDGSRPPVRLGNLDRLQVRVQVDEQEIWKLSQMKHATGFVRGNSDQRITLSFLRREPFVQPKRSLTGASDERVDTRVLFLVYEAERPQFRLYAGQQLDVFIPQPDKEAL